MKCNSIKNSFFLHLESVIDDGWMHDDDDDGDKRITSGIKNKSNDRKLHKPCFTDGCMYFVTLYVNVRYIFLCRKMDKKNSRE